MMLEFYDEGGGAALLMPSKIGRANLQIATIDQNGVAQCVQGATGMVTISAIVSSNSANAPAMSTGVSAVAMLNCP